MKKNYHQAQVPQITVDEAWSENSALWIDVRTPGEYEQGTVPGALNIPLFSNEERSILGTLYKNMGQKDAVKEGYTFIESKLSRLHQQTKIFPKDQLIIVLCARGGMRSRSFVALLLSYGFQVCQLIDGYKAFRNWNLQQFEKFRLSYPLIVLHGKTGVGKTLLLQQLPNSLDLEKLAQHRGSLLGHIGKKPATQKTFEANLLAELHRLNLNQPIFIEGESRKIGSSLIPKTLFDHMSQGVKVLIKANLECRIQRIIGDYVLLDKTNHQELTKALANLKKQIGKQAIQQLEEWLREKAYSKVIRYLCESYYDPKYEHSLNKRRYHRQIDSSNLDEAIQILLQLQKSLEFLSSVKKSP